ncbi:MAG: hypothetical protein ACT4QG_19515 [Sporichthyaceae bacterium]
MTTTRRVQTSSGEKFVVSTEILDGLMRHRQMQTQVPDAEVTPGGGRLVTGTVYDSRGLAVFEYSPAWLADSGPNTTLTLPSGNLAWRTVTAYDGAGRATESAFAQNQTVKWRTKADYTGNSVTVTPPTGGVKTKTVTDARGRTIELHQYPDRASSATLKTTYGYSAAGELLSMKDPAGTEWTWAYDVAGRQISSTDPDRGTTTSTYDSLGQVRTTTGPDGAVLGYTYDNLGRRTSVREGSDAADAPVRASWTYDSVRKGLPASATRKIVYGAASGDLTTTVTAYDVDRPKATSTTVPNIPGLTDDLHGVYAVGAVYNDDGSVKNVDLGAFRGAAAERLRYSYDAVGAPVALSGAGTYVSNTFRSAWGEATRYVYGNTFGRTVWQDLTYAEGTGRLAKNVLNRQTSTTGPDENTTFVYDDAGNAIAIDAVLAAGQRDTQCFRYDGLRQLTDAWTPADNECTNADEPIATTTANPAPYSMSWTFDPNGNGNRETQTVRGASTPLTEYTYRPDTHQVETVTNGAQVDRYGWTNAAGKTTGGVQTRTPHGKAAQTFTWDAEGQLTRIADSTGKILAENWYDASGKRILHRETGADGKVATTLSLGGLELTRTVPTTGTATTAWNRYYTFDGHTVAVRDGNAMTDVQILPLDPQNTSQWAIETGTGTIAARRTLPYGGQRGANPVGWVADRSFVGGTPTPPPGSSGSGHATTTPPWAGS